jgi:hypothetical protein
MNYFKQYYLKISPIFAMVIRKKLGEILRPMTSNNLDSVTNPGEVF